ncbi:MAG: histone deacetylase [Planctomycetota bacterium]
MGPRRLWYSPGYTLRWPGHVFPVRKYERLHDRLLAEGVARSEDFGEPRPLGRRTLLLGHDRAYLDRLEAMTADPAQGWLEFEAPCTPEVLAAFLLMAGGTLEAARVAVAHGGFTANLGGGFHHAFPYKGEGFCAINDVVVALRALLHEGLVDRAAVVDLDVHQGNGTAVAFADEPRVFTLSLHQENNYPVKQRSDLDVGLPDACSDEAYLTALAGALPAVQAHDPRLVVYVAGADPYRGDRLGGLDLGFEGLASRDRMVYEAFLDRGVPVVATLAGGYAEHEADVVEIHFRMIRAGLERAASRNSP